MADYPKEMTLREIMQWAEGPAHENIQGMKDAQGNDYWLPARYLPYEPINPFKRARHRLRLAWMVFTGRADVLHWR